MGKKTKTVYPRESDVSPDPIKIVLWNVGGPSAGTGTASKRKRVIIKFLESIKCYLFLSKNFFGVT